MMKKTQFIELLRTIKKTTISFISIVVFVMLGIGVFLGIDWSIDGFKNTLDETTKQGKMHNAELIYPYGFDEEFVQELKQEENVDRAEGYYSCDRVFEYGEYLFQVRVVSLTDEVDVPASMVGSLPSKVNEIALEKGFADIYGIKVGDKIQFSDINDSGMFALKALFNEDLDTLENIEEESKNISPLKTNTFDVTAIIASPQYMCKFKICYGANQINNVPYDCVMFVNKDAFNLDTLVGYSGVLVANDKISKLNTFSNEYKQETKTLIEEVKEPLNKYAENRNNKLLSSIQNVENKINEKIDDGEKQIEDGRIKVEDGKKLIADSKVLLADAKKLLDDSQLQVDKGWIEVNDANKQINDYEAKLSAFQKVYDTTLKVLDVYVYIIDNNSTLFNAINTIHTLYELKKTDIQTTLPDDYYILELVNELWAKLNAGEYDGHIDKFVGDYIAIIDKIQNNENYQSIPKIIEDLNNTNDPDLMEIASKLDDLFSKAEEYMSLPTELVELYKMLAKFGMLRIFEEKINTEIEKYLISKNCITLKELFNELTDVIDNGYQTYEQLSPYIQKIITKLEESTVEIKKIKEYLLDKKYLLDDAWVELNDAKAQVNAATSKLISAQKDIDQGLIEYNDGLKTLKEKQIELADGIKQLEDGEKQLIEAKDSLKKYQELTYEIKAYDATTLDRESNASLVFTSVPLNILKSVKYTLALLFVLVGVFVSYTAISRLVYERSKLIGTKKALGLHSREITISFLLYVFFAVIIGSFLGFFFGRFFIEPITIGAFCDNFVTVDNLYYYSLFSVVLFFLFETLINGLSAYLACKNVLKKKAITLLNGENTSLAKSRFYEKLPVWNKLSLFTKTIINNFFNDGRRVFGTLVGIVGCCALMTSPLLLNLDMIDSLDYQLNKITTFDTVICFDSQKEGCFEDIQNRLEQNGIEYCPAYSSTFYLKENDGNFFLSNIYAYDDDKFLEFFNLMDRRKNIEVIDGLYISEAMCNYNNYKTDDLIEFIDNQGNKYQTNFAGRFDYYALRNQMVINSSTFEKVLNKEYFDNTFVIKRGDKTIPEMNELVEDIEGILSVYDSQIEYKAVNNAVISTTYIVLAVFFALAIALALLVLLNLLAMFVDEKKKELIVLMINGYSKKDAKKYIYKDTILLMIIGIILGCIIGSLAGMLTLKTFESEAIAYIIKPNLKACLIAALVTAFLTAFTSFISLRRVSKLKLVDINS